MDFFKFLESFSRAETIIGLLAFLIAAVLGLFALQSRNKYKRIGEIISKANTETKANLAVALAGVLPAYKIPDLTRSQGFEVVKLQLEQRAKEFKTRSNMLRFGMILLFVLIAGIIVKGYTSYRKEHTINKTSGDQSPIIIGDSAHLEFNNDTVR